MSYDPPTEAEQLGNIDFTLERIAEALERIADKLDPAPTPDYEGYVIGPRGEMVKVKPLPVNVDEWLRRYELTKVGP